MWIQYARAKNIAPLLNRFVQYPIIYIVNSYLLLEIFDALIDNKWMHPQDAMPMIAFIRKISVANVETTIYALSPDPKDNYLFNLAIQNNYVFIVTDDSLMLRFSMSPVPAPSSKWFLKKFPA